MITKNPTSCWIFIVTIPFATSFGCLPQPVDRSIQERAVTHHWTSSQQNAVFTWEISQKDLSILLLTNDQRTCSPEQWDHRIGPRESNRTSEFFSVYENWGLSRFRSLLKLGVSLFGEYCVSNRPSRQLRKVWFWNTEPENNLLFSISSSVFEVDQMLILFIGYLYFFFLSAISCLSATVRWEFIA